MATLRQIAAVCSWNFKSIFSRFQSASVVAIGFFAVVLVFVAVLSIRDGLLRGLNGDDLDTVALVYAKSGVNGLDATALETIRQAPGVAQDAQGPLVAPTLFAVIEIPKWAPGLLAVTTLRGIDQNFPQMMPQFRIVAGRSFKPGLDEIIVGQTAEKLYSGLAIGDTLRWERRSWKVVGIFSTGSALRDSSLLTDIHQLQAVNATGNHYSSVYARLTAPGVFPAFKDALEHNAALHVNVETLGAYDRQSSQSLSTLLVLADGIITLLMAVGAVFGALNIMYANVARRTSEIATLRALGFARLPIFVAVMSETLALALFGGVLGVAVAALAFNGFEASTSIGGASVGFKFAVTAGAVEVALALTLLMGFFGGLFPSLRAARLPIATALRDA